VAELAHSKEQLELRVLDLIMTRAKNALVTLTDAERAALHWFAHYGLPEHRAATLRGLLERLHPAASGYTHGVSASKETKEESRWISTADQMPGHIEEVLMYFGDDSDQQVVRTGYYDTGEDSDRSNGLTVADLRGWWVHTGSDESEKIDESEAPPTHWMLCPGPPDE
jgi:hypothetical protein